MAVNLDIDIDLGTKYLTNISAYFLGAIFASAEYVEKDGTKYIVAPARYNKPSITNIDFENHYYAVRNLAGKLKKHTLLSEHIIANNLNTGKFNKRMYGFGTFFECSKDLNLEQETCNVLSVLKDSDKIIHRCFLVGMFDGRGYYDKHTGYMVFDSANDNLSDFLCNVIHSYGLQCNYNPERERGNKESKNRAPQIRINKREKFQENIGFISPQRIKKYFDLYNTNSYEIVEENDILQGLKVIRRIKNG